MAKTSSNLHQLLFARGSGRRRRSKTSIITVILMMATVVLPSATSFATRLLVRSFHTSSYTCRCRYNNLHSHLNVNNIASANGNHVAPALSLAFTSDYHQRRRQQQKMGSLRECRASIVRTYMTENDDDLEINIMDVDDDVLYEEYVEDIKHAGSMIDKDDDNDGNVQSELSDKNKREQLKKELIQYRSDQASSIEKPAYTIFTNAAVEGICATLPADEAQLLEVKGIGPKKLDLYGDDILDIVGKYNGLLSKTDVQIINNNGSTKMGAVPRPAPITIESLTTEQKTAANIAHNGKSIFISGAAGVGKSHVSKYIIQDLTKNKKRKCSPTAPTGVAAINVGGNTLHSFFGIGLGQGSMSSLVKRVMKKKEVVKRITETDVLLIDEVSMLSSELLETLDGVARQVRNKPEEVMGGMQIVAVGDFFQLPPIVQQQGYASSYYDYDVDEQRPFCFDSPVWEELGLNDNTIQLTEVKRQESGSKFEAFLHMVRVGEVPSTVLRDFNQKCLISNTHPLPDDGIIPTRIYTHNRDVDTVNESRLDELEGDLVVCKANDIWREKMPVGTAVSVKKTMKTSIAGELPDEVRLKVGAQVMLTRNKDLDNGHRSLVNGSRGVVERFDGNVPVVRFDNGRVEKITSVEAMRYNPDGGLGALVRTQLPLKLAWATTVHKSQGSTLSRAILDISKTFEAGQAYVSLSRVQGIDGLYLERPVIMENIQVSRRVIQYYQQSS